MSSEEPRKEQKFEVTLNPKWKGSAISLRSVQVTNVSDNPGKYVVDIEIQDGPNHTVAQGKNSCVNVFFNPGDTKYCAMPDPPLGPGTYTVNIGLFTENWAQMIAWQPVAIYTVY